MWAHLKVEVRSDEWVFSRGRMPVLDDIVRLFGSSCSAAATLLQGAWVPAATGSAR